MANYIITVGGASGVHGGRVNAGEMWVAGSLAMRLVYNNNIVVVKGH